MLEILISLLILSFIALALTQSTIYGIRHNSYLEHKQTALDLARGCITHLSSLPSDSAMLDDDESGSFMNSPSPDPDGEGDYYLIDDGNQQFDGDPDINDDDDHDSGGIDHPNSSGSYTPIAPIEQVGPITYYKIWGVADGSHQKRIVVMVYWFRNNDTSQEPHSVDMETLKVY